MDVRDWLVKFLVRHKARLDPFDWPDDYGDEWLVFVRCWVSAFTDQGVTEAEADAASERLTLSPPRYRREHLPAVMAVLKDFRKPKVNLNEWLETRPDRIAERAREQTRREELQASWDAMEPADQAYVRAAVLRDNPGLSRFEPFVRRLCLERITGLCVDQREAS